jgi:hypothetical protein
MKKGLLISLVLIVALMGCKKSSEEEPIPVDLAATASGLYTGNFVVPILGNLPGSCKLTKVTTTTLNIDITMMDTTFQAPGIIASDGGNGVVKLSLIAEGDTLSGTVSGKTLNLKIGSSPMYVNFTGTKP